MHCVTSTILAQCVGYSGFGLWRGGGCKPRITISIISWCFTWDVIVYDLRNQLSVHSPLSQLLVVFNQLSFRNHKKVFKYFQEGHTENSLNLTKSVNGSRKWKIKTVLVGFGMLRSIRRIFASRIFKRWGVAPPPPPPCAGGTSGGRGQRKCCGR